MRTTLIAAAAAALLGALALGQTAAAQYAFAAMWDGNAPVLIRGKVTKVEWIDPYPQIHLVEDGSNQPWIVEGASKERVAPEIKARLSPGVPIIVRGYMAKDKRCTPACRANARDVTFADATKVFVSTVGCPPQNGVAAPSPANPPSCVRPPSPTASTR
jgi:hypothetical protein